MSGVQEAAYDFMHEAAGTRFRRFGPFGPTYEILQAGGETARVRVTESGEEFDHPTQQLLADPVA